MVKGGKVILVKREKKLFLKNRSESKFNNLVVTQKFEKKGSFIIVMIKYTNQEKMTFMEPGTGEKSESWKKKEK